MSEDVAPRGAEPAGQRRRAAPPSGKFARWKKAIRDAFDTVDEDAVKYMFFQLTGKNDNLVIQFGHSPHVPSQK